MREKKKYLDGTNQILQKTMKEKKKYMIKVLGKEFVVYPNVFSPKYFNDTMFFAENLPVNRGEELLEIGSGTGVISIFAIWKGAAGVVATDVNPDAVRNIKENVRIHGLEKKIRVLHGEIFSPLSNEKFNTIFWNAPFAYVKRKDLSMLERSVYDPDYRSAKTFIGNAHRYMKPDGRLILGFSSTIGHMGELKKILKKAGYKSRIIKEIDSTETHPVKFQIIESVLKKK